MLADDDLSVDDDFVVRRGTTEVGLLNPGVLLGRSDGRVRAVYGPRGTVKLTGSDRSRGLFEAFCAAGAILFGSKPAIEQVSAFLKDDHWSRTASYFCSIMSTCEEIVRSIEVLAASRIAIVGCGGIGSLAAVLLAGLNVQQLTLVDPDVIERSNLNRQLFWRAADIGQQKVETLASVIASRHPAINVQVVAKAMTAADLRAMAVSLGAMILTADQPISLVRELDIIARKHPRLVLLSAGYVHDRASVTLHRASASYQRGGLAWDRIVGGIMPSYGPSNAEIAGRAVALLVRALIGADEHAAPIDLSWRPHVPSPAWKSLDR